MALICSWFYTILKAVANRRSFKTDESFLEKLAIGAIGARAVADRLKQEGHCPIELERGSMSYKLWKQVRSNGFAYLTSSV